jgi:exocyst complex component 2
MAHDIIKLYVSLLSEFFVFSDMAVTTPQGEGSSAPFLPEDSNSLTTAHYLMKILTEIQDNVNEINSMEISGEMSSSLKGLLESAKWGFEDVITHAWVRGMFDCTTIDFLLLIPIIRRACILLLRNLGALFIGTLHN